MRLSSRRVDDADLIRARLRVLLDEGHRRGGWLPDDLPDEEPSPPIAVERSTTPVRGRWHSGGQEDRDRDADGRDDGDGDGDGDDGDLPAGIGRHRAPGPAVRVAPTRRSVRALLLAGLLGAFVLVGWTWVDRPRAEPVEEQIGGASAAVPSPAPASPSVGTAADTAPTVTVSVVGRVARPGLVVLPAGSRIADAIAAAGGLLPDADPAAVNLAALLTDGQQIVVGVPGPAPGSAAPAAGGRVQLNSATAADLDALPGIGPVLAQRIVDYRTQNGPFTAVEQLDDVPGIGPAIFDELADLVAV